MPTRDAEGWKFAWLQDLAVPGGFSDGDWIESKDQSPDGTVRLLQVGNVLQGRLRTDGALRWVTEETVARLKCTVLHEGDILIARMPDPIGRACLVPKLPYKAITAVDCAILRTDEPVCDRNYLVQALNWPKHLKKVESLISGTTRQRISRGNLGQMEVPLPPLPEQRKIAAILSSVDDTIEKTEAVIDQLEVVKKGLLGELLTRGMPGRHKEFRDTEVGRIPASWRVAKVRDLCVLTSGGTPHRGTPAYWGGDLPWVKTGEVDYRDITTTEERITLAGVQSSAAKPLPPGTLLMAMYGQGVTRGKVAILAIEAAVNQACLAFLPSAAVCNRFLLYWFTREYETLRAIGNETTQKNLSAMVVGSLKVPTPSLDEQDAIIEALQAIDQRIESERLLSEATHHMKTALLDALLSGHVRVADPAQEVV